MLYGRTKVTQNSLGRWSFMLTNRNGGVVRRSDKSYDTEIEAKIAAREITAPRPSQPNPGKAARGAHTAS